MHNALFAAAEPSGRSIDVNATCACLLGVLGRRSMAPLNSYCPKSTSISVVINGAYFDNVQGMINPLSLDAQTRLSTYGYNKGHSDGLAGEQYHQVLLDA